jgi:hypothetical protein
MHPRCKRCACRADRSSSVAHESNRGGAAAGGAAALVVIELEGGHSPESLRTKSAVDCRVKALAEEWLVFFEYTVAAEHSFKCEAGFDGDAP